MEAGCNQWKLAATDESWERERWEQDKTYNTVLLLLYTYIG